MVYTWIFVVILCTVFFCMLKRFTFLFLTKGYRYLEIRVKGDKWQHQSSERMIFWDGIRGRLSPESRDYKA